jgi:hypothetical protein
MLDKLTDEVDRDFSGRLIVGEDRTEIDFRTGMPGSI